MGKYTNYRSQCTLLLLVTKSVTCVFQVVCYSIFICRSILLHARSLCTLDIQVADESELRSQPWIRCQPKIWRHTETTDQSQKLASVLMCLWRRAGYVTLFTARVNSTWFFKIINRNQHDFHIYLRNIEHICTIRIRPCAGRVSAIVQNLPEDPT